MTRKRKMMKKIKLMGVIRMIRRKRRKIMVKSFDHSSGTGR